MKIRYGKVKKWLAYDFICMSWQNKHSHWLMKQDATCHRRKSRNYENPTSCKEKKDEDLTFHKKPTRNYELHMMSITKYHDTIITYYHKSIVV